MINAKEEFIEDVKGLKVRCAKIHFGRYSDDEGFKFAILKEGYSKEEYQEFLDKLDFEYDAGYGGQELFGIIWCEDGVWLDRGEYDGSEWWEEHKYPDIDLVVGFD